MEHKLFKPKSFEEARHAVVGDCNSISMEERWKIETPLFAEAVLKYAGDVSNILDYGCGVGRIAKEILARKPRHKVVGLDNSSDMLVEANRYVNNPQFETTLPNQLKDKFFDLAYCIYVLQHVPAIEIRTILQRIHHHLKDDGIFIYCSSDYRMAIRYDQAGFFDDRFLGVNLREEISRYFIKVGELFDSETIVGSPVLQKMIKGDLPHPALVYTKKKIKNYWNADIENKSNERLLTEPKAVNIGEPNGKTNLLLHNRLSPGDILVMTNAIRDLHKAYPGKYLTDVRSPAPDIFINNPYITKLDYNEKEYNVLNAAYSRLPQNDMSKESRTAMLGDILSIDMHYPLIHSSGECGWHFSYGHRVWLEEMLGVDIPQTTIYPEIYLSEQERNWQSPLSVHYGITQKYWVINAGAKNDTGLKQYPYYQDVIDMLISKMDIKVVQIGQKTHLHKPLNGSIDMLGKTNLRELFRLIYHAEGVITCVSLPMHIAAAFRKPCVVIGGAREGTRWELYPNQQFIYVNGCLLCATGDGCWRANLNNCNNKIEGVPRCMTLIKPEDIIRGVERYYDGGILQVENILQKSEVRV